MNFKLPNITIVFKSLKDLGNVYKLELTNLKQVIGSISTEEDLREAELLLKEMIALVETKKARMYQAKQEEK